MPRLAALLVVTFVWGCGTDNTAPVIDPIVPQKIQVGETLELLISARDADGDPLSFTATPKPFTARFENRDGQYFFIWAPLPPDAGPTGTQTHAITFQCDDGNGGVATRVVTITVELSVGPPVFVGGAGFVLNLSEDDDISIVVSVKDDDSEKVVLRVVGGIDGAKFVKLSEKSASFYWKPTDEQKKMGNYWQLDVGAKDEKHAEVRRKYSILLMNADAAKSCSGTPPIIEYTPIGDLYDSSFVFKASATDFESSVREITVHYALSNPLDPASYVGNSVGLVQCPYPQDPGCPEDVQDRYFTKGMPSAGASSPVPLFFYYYITALDNDDVKGTTCDLSSRLPKSGYFTTAAYPAGWSGGCKDDDSEPNDQVSMARPISPGAILERRACNKLFPNEDWYQVDVVPGTVLNVELLHEPAHGSLEVSLHDGAGGRLAPMVGAPATDHLVYIPSSTPVYVRVGVPAGLPGSDMSYALVVNTTQGTCDNDTYEPNDSVEAATLVPTGVYKMIICPGDRDYLRVQAGAGETIVAELDFQHAYGDLDMAIYDLDGNRLATSETATSSERIVYHVADISTHILEIRGYQGQINTGELTLSVVPTNTLCFEDGFSPNHVLDAAQLLPENQYGPLLSCANKPDWFRVDVNENERVLVYAYPLVFQGGVLSLKVHHDPQGALTIPDVTAPELAAQFPPDAVFNTSIKGSDGSVWFQLSTPGAVTFPYLLSFAVYDPIGICLDDRFGPNKTPKEALKVTSDDGFVTRLKICGPGEDWFRIEGRAFEELFVYVFGFGSEQPMLTASLHKYASANPNDDGPMATGPNPLVQVDQGHETTNGVELRYLPDKNEDFYIHVQGAGNLTYHYDLVFGVE